MTWERLGLTRRPFRATPALDLYVPVPAHESAIGLLRTAYQGGAGLALLDGVAGTGKSLIALRFLESLGSDVLPVYVPSARFGSIADLHRSILFDLGRDYRGLPEHELRLSLVDLFLKSLADSKRAVLVLDEAQHLSSDVLEELRLLDNWDARGVKATFTVLVAQPELRTRLQGPEDRLIAGRIDRRVALEPLSANDARTFLRAQLEACSRRPEEVLTDEAIDWIVSQSGGIPRTLNRLAAASFDLAVANGMDCVDLEVVMEAGVGVGLAGEPESSSTSSQPAKSNGGGTGDVPEGRESPTGRSPKVKARNRRAA